MGDRIPVLVALVTMAAVAAAGFWLGEPGVPAAVWQDELEQLTTDLGAGYANLQWVVQAHALDLPDLLARTRQELERTRTRSEARAVFRRFLAAFGDPHLRAENWEPPPRQQPEAQVGQRTGDGTPAGAAVSPPPPAATSGPTPETPVTQVLEELGFHQRDLDFRLGFPDGVFTRLGGSSPLAAGLVRLDDGVVAGVLRIADFGEDGYPGLAAAAWEEHRQGLDGPCDRACRGAFRDRVMQRLVDEVGSRVQALADAGMDLLVVDITGNGGGTDWAGVVPWQLTDMDLKCLPEGMVRHPHGNRQLTWTLAVIDEALAMESLHPVLRPRLAAERERTARLLEELGLSCDMTPLWQGLDPGCSQVVTSRSGMCGRPPVDPASLSAAGHAGSLFATWSLDHVRGLWSGPLALLTDGGTASAAEQFAALLHGSGAATLVGTRTVGAGCGYTWGGISSRLRHAGLRVRMPDCVRYTAAGENELAGLAPDLPVDWGRRARGRGDGSRLLPVLRRWAAGVLPR